MSNILYVNVSSTVDLDQHIRVGDIAPWAAAAWPISLARVLTADRIVACHRRTPIAAWVINDAYHHRDLTYSRGTGDQRPRTAVALGDVLPILPVYARHLPAMLYTAAVVAVDELSDIDIARRRVG